MENNKFFVEKIRFHLYKENTISFVGWYFDGHVRGREIQAFLDGKECDVQCDIHSGAEVRQKYLGNFNEINDEIIGMITLPQDWKKGKRLVLTVREENSEKKAYAIAVRILKKIQTQGMFSLRCWTSRGIFYLRR